MEKGFELTDDDNINGLKVWYNKLKKINEDRKLSKQSRGHNKF